MRDWSQNAEENLPVIQTFYLKHSITHLFARCHHQKSIDIGDRNTSFEHFYLSSPTPSITIKKQFHPIYLLLRWIFIYTLIAVYIEIERAQNEILGEHI